ncbi:MarR family transcriptional regulator [Secundilactobacillus paracollinoides DSM 15502 = JCM 11969]|nr:MarR family transcriptional regulator [Secundilactobacillus paracollinoides DSM 15502 = JCM 11969]
MTHRKEDSVLNKQAQFMASMSSLIDKTTLLEHTQLDEQLAGYKPAEVHTIEFIGNHPDANVTIIANAMYVTRGAVSKMTRRLMKNALIERYQKPDNKKEIYFRLTAKGKDVYNTHAALNRQFEDRDAALFTETDQSLVDDTLAFLAAYNQHLDDIINQKK